MLRYDICETAPKLLEVIGLVRATQYERVLPPEQSERQGWLDQPQQCLATPEISAVCQQLQYELDLNTIAGNLSIPLIVRGLNTINRMIQFFKTMELMRNKSILIREQMITASMMTTRNTPSQVCQQLRLTAYTLRT